MPRSERTASPRSNTSSSWQSDFHENDVPSIEDQLDNLNMSAATPPPSPPPYHSSQHGKDHVHIQVGPDSSPIRSLYWDLLISQSQYFEHRLAGMSREIVPIIRIPELNHDAFEVIYQYLLTGNIHSGDDEDDDMYGTALATTDPDLFWLHALHAAAFLKIPTLTSEIYDLFITSIFAADQVFEPSISFFTELFRTSTPRKGTRQLRNLVIAKTAWTIMHTDDNWSAGDWDLTLVAAGPRVWKSVLLEVSKLRSRHPAPGPTDPVLQKRFEVYNQDKTDTTDVVVRERSDRSSTVSAGRA
jgi:hypothetical protein